VAHRCRSCFSWYQSAAEPCRSDYFRKIIDDYALNPGNIPENTLIAGVLLWLGVAVVIAVLARFAKTFQDYFARLAVQMFGMQIYNDGLEQTLRPVL